MTTDSNKDRFPLLRRILKAIGLPAEAIDDIVERILDWLSTKEESTAGPTTLPFKLRDDFLSNAELSFYQVLRGVVAQRALVFTKVNLGDLFFVATGDQRKNRALANRIDRKHVDFLLCDPKTVRPIVAIELDDKSHERPDRMERDELVQGVFSAAGLPLIRIAVKASYAPLDAEALISPYLKPLAAATVPVQPMETAAAPSDRTPVCPKCGATMLLRTAKTGANAGGKFWGCPNFPRCRAVFPAG